MKSIVWNARGLGSGRAFRTLLHLKQIHKPDVVFLIETKAKHSLLELVRVKLEFVGKLVVECVGRSGGLCLLWSGNVTVDLLSYTRYHIDVKMVTHGLKCWRFTGFYGHPDSAQRHHSWTLLRRLHGMASLPWLCVGDFNELLEENEKEGGLERSSLLMDNFRDTLDLCGLEDVGFSGPRFTWSNKREGNDHIQERIDRGVCNFQWKQMFQFAGITHLDFWGSDHRPLLVDILIVPIVDRGALHPGRRFHFEACWADEEEGRKLIDDNWGQNAGLISMEEVCVKIKKCTSKLSLWNASNRVRLRKQIVESQRDLSLASADIRAGSWANIRRLENKLDCLLEKEECYWRQRSRTEWLKGGDKNTKYFHWKASMRRTRNTIKGLWDCTGIWQSEKCDMVGVISQYFEQLFSSSNPSNGEISRVTNSVHTRLSSRSRDFLDRPFTADEVRQSVFSMSPLKAPGLDGLPAMFYQKCWSTVGEGISKACLRCLNEGDSVEMVNRTLITLVPKIQQATNMTDFRPISLCNVTYKIVAKTLANRFRLVLDEVILEAQSAFIPGRLISDNAIVGFECIHALRTKTRVKGSMALKLDMSKAYDRVEWEFLACMMDKLGFSASWIGRIMRFVRSVSFSFLLNGEVCGNINASRGLRQGDPLSPYLFLICAEGLSSLLNQAVVDGRLSGFQCGRSGPLISHLFFADDSLLFANATEADYRSIRYILDVYAKASGQVINFNKSALCVSNSVGRGLGIRLADIAGVKWVKCHERYLGLPSFASRNKKKLFSAIKDRVWDKVKGWRNKLLSVGGKEVLIKAVIQAIPTYSMSLFRLPKGLISDLHRLCARFWWGSSETTRKIHWCSWRHLCMSKECGGMGFRDLEVFNRALLAKQGWRLICNPHSLAARVLKSCYYPSSSFLQANCSNSSSFLWKSFCWGRDILEAGSRWRIGDGTSVAIYNDRWIPRPSMFKIFSPPVLGARAKVHSLLSPFGGWNVPLIFSSFFREDAEAILSLLVSSFRMPDSLTWHFEKSGSYSVRSGYKVGLGMVSNPSSSGLSGTVSWWKFLWCLRIPMKIRIFIWKTCLNWIPSFVNLGRRGVHTDRWCPVCLQSPESTMHALWGCSSLKCLRSSCYFLQDLVWSNSASFLDFLIVCSHVLKQEEMELLCVIFWRVWWRRNQVVHNAAVRCDENILGWSVDFLGGFRAANDRAAGCLNVCHVQARGWSCPTVGLYKINTDAAIRSVSNQVGLGIVIRDHSGVVMGSSAQVLSACLSPQLAEALAVVRGIKLAIDFNLLPVVVEPDASLLLS